MEKIVMSITCTYMTIRELCGILDQSLV